MDLPMITVEYKKLNNNKDKYLDLARELKKTVEHGSDGYTNWNWCSGTITDWYKDWRTWK